MNHLHTKSHKPDYTLITLILIILSFGMIMLSSASSVVSYRNFSQSYYYLVHQFIMGFLPGIILFILASKIKYDFWKKIALPAFVFSLVLMIAVFIPGIGSTHGTANSWISLFGLSFQPSELLKLTLIIYLASIFSKSDSNVTTFEEGLLPMGIILGVISGLLIAQPDVGTLMILAFIAVGIYFVAGGYIWHIISLGGVGLAGLIVLIQVAPYRMARFMAFLDPSKDPLGIGYHINQSLIAVGSGGFFGVGLGQSRQKFSYLPEVYCDSIFAVVAEEMGFLIVILLLAAFMLLVVRGFKIARESGDSFAKLTAIGISLWFVLQAVINIMSMIGLMPMTGVPLTFVSYGGSAMAINLLSAGILVNISKYSRV